MAEFDIVDLTGDADRIAELEREVEKWKQEVNRIKDNWVIGKEGALARMAFGLQQRIDQLLRNLHSIEDFAYEILHEGEDVQYGHPHWANIERIYRIAREAQTTDEQLGPENNQIAT